ncbi:MAG: polysaccharide biosynthesis protein [Oscillospiraceae bacterium]|nr:polysaccharide biosynthesis protein [Oscillospiraceae bacterium]
MPESRKQNFLKGAAILAATSIIARVIGLVYRIPMFRILGHAGMGIFQTAHLAYTLILTLCTAGISVALSRMISSANEEGKTSLIKRYFSVSLPAFMFLGLAATAFMFFFPNVLAGIVRNPYAAPGIRLLAPAVFFMCIIAIYRGYAQGFENMIPTATSQIVEVVCRTVFGIAIASMLFGRRYDMQYVAAGANIGTTIGLGLAIPAMVYLKKKIDKRVSNPSRARSDLPSRATVLRNIISVSAPITLGASFMVIANFLDTTVVLGRLQSGLGLPAYEANAYLGMFTLGATVFNLPPALIVPISVSIIPAIASAISSGRRGMAGNIMQSSLKIVNLLAMPAAIGIMALAQPILIALFNDSYQTTSTMLTILGAASFFTCLQLITTAILQATGHERVTMLTFPIGGAAMIALDYILVGNPNIGIIGSAFGTLLCYVIISLLNITFILKRVKDRPKFGGVFVKPLLCSAVMGVAAYSVYGVVSRLGYNVLGSGRMAVVAYLAIAMIAAAIVYFVLIIVTRTLTRDDMLLLPKGEKLADLLKIR